MKKLLKGLVLLTTLAMMVTGMSVIAFADDDEEAPVDDGSAIVQDAGEGEDAPEDDVVSTTEAIDTANPDTGASTPFGIAAAAMSLIAIGAVPIAMGAVKE